MIRDIAEILFETDPFHSLKSRAESLRSGESLFTHGINGSLMAFVVAALFERRQSQILLIAADRDKAQKLRDDCALLLGDGNVCYFDEHPTSFQREISPSVAHIEALKALAEGATVAVVATAEAVVSPLPSPEKFAASLFELRAHGEHNFARLIEHLASLGFDRKDFVEGYGDFSVRGGILDVFPHLGDNPIRLEFWGDTIESIREFDVLSQRSIRELKSATIAPDIFRPSGSSDNTAVFEYLSKDALIILDEPEIIGKEIAEFLDLAGIDEPDGKSILARATGFVNLRHSAIRPPDGQEVIDFGSASQPGFRGSIKALLQRLDELNGRGISTYIGCDTKEEVDRLRELIDEERQDFSADLKILPETIHSGFLFPAGRLALFTEHEIFGRLKRRGLARRRRFRGFSPKELQQLKRGDYVVHEEYGIGQFAGLQKISVRSAEQEVMKILYLENDVLYVNLNSIGRVEKYSSHEGHVPKLNKLGTADWERLRLRAKRRVKDIARDLIKLYARRKAEQGFAFSSDTHWQKEMEASFIYEDTEDQARTTREMKEDMQSDSPMDRLICGDVGFGKTEIAVRAAFKAVQDGKQVAVLVPTTILAQQHHNTFQDRLGRYPVRVEFISRFKDSKELKNVLRMIRGGDVDVIIGTHRLLSPDVEFKDLGLLVIDEEHRFGVTAKEKLRRLRAAVDTLTLTATPIPRTLYFSLMGARDISLINTPPRNRLPIVTDIAQFDWKLIREAILREIHRGGQVYFVHDRVQRIDDMRALLEEHVPEARYVVAHGQVRGHQLEKVMVAFLEKKHDVLVCTKIIESGIDIPNVNTIIINRADRFGLAELYQLRGRVGRSNVQAYCHLLTPPVSVLPKQAIRRLQALEEFTELGSGFNLAMRDLEIRGTGNLLGAEQSGFIVEMGYETYERIVREAVDELKREEHKDLVKKVLEPLQEQTTVDADIDAYIPEIYVESDVERLEIYRRLVRVQSPSQIDEIRGELCDRFGEYPPEVENLLLVVQLRLLGSRLGARKLTVDEGRIRITLPEADSDWFYGNGENGETSKFQRVLNALGDVAKGDFRLKQDGKTLTLIVEGLVLGDGAERLASMKEFLATLVERV